MWFCFYSLDSSPLLATIACFVPCILIMLMPQSEVSKACSNLETLAFCHFLHLGWSSYLIFYSVTNHPNTFGIKKKVLKERVKHFCLLLLPKIWAICIILSSYSNCSKGQSFNFFFKFLSVTHQFLVHCA